MAKRRMFSLDVTDTDAFLDLPTSSQALYFHLGMHGDDDGFVSSPRRVARAAGCNEDDFRLLIAKGFLIPFDSGVVVIRDWRINNTLKNDRYRETLYTAEKQALQIDASGRYRKTGTSLEPVWNQNGTNLEPQHNLTKHNLTNTPLPPVRDDAEFARFWSSYPRKAGKKAAEKAFSRAMKQTDLATLLGALEKHKQTQQWTKDGGQFIPHPATWLNQERWNDELAVTETEPKTELPMVAVETGEYLPDGAPVMRWEYPDKAVSA